MKMAALDLGSNTFLCLIAEVVNNKIGEVYSDSVEIVRLGQGLDKTNKFHDEALLRADGCLERFKKIISDTNPEKILAMATSAARDATNKEELFKICKKHNIPIEIISGDQEAKITYLGAISGVDFQNQNKNLMVIDIGGGSTELIFGKNQNIVLGNSANIGCVRLTEKFITKQPISDEEMFSAKKFIEENILSLKLKLPSDIKIDQMIAVAGTPTTLVAAELGGFDIKKIDGFILDQKKLKSWCEKLKNTSIEEKIKIGIPAGRADVIYIGSLILLSTLELFELEQLSVSTRGVRYGIALEMGRRF